MTNIVKLPRPLVGGGAPVWETIGKRRTVRTYRPVGLELGQVSQLLWATAGVTGGTAYLRAAPSAGARHPATVFLVCNDVSGLERGVYVYVPAEHALRPAGTGSFGEPLAAACLGQDMLARAPAVFGWCVAPEEAARKYGERGTRYTLMDLGHACQNLYLAATALGLGCCAIGAFRDEEVNAIFSALGLRGAVLYMATVGVPA
ncbi:MAG: SagB/ThcOx family dehydrogenase [Firmicutes bacterium]|jgi:SagB-type dehydrogenase family enzyme|nr:SagB/ThcOx family dehydrogenase [Bacillota bacterium]